MCSKETEMSKVARLALPIGLVFFLLVSAGAASALEDHPAAPDFKLRDLKGKEVSLADYEGKVLFMNFWATWCGPCRAEIPDFIEVYDEYKDKGLEILGVSVDEISPDKVLRFVKTYEMNYPVVMFTDDLINNYRPGRAVPTTIIIDKKGRIRHKQIGMMSKEMLISLFNEVSKED
jgi:peroxiredoxin